MSWQRRQILITGASRGLGAKMAEYFLNKGDLVIGCSRQDSAMAHSHYTHYCVDITDEEVVKNFFVQVRKSFKYIDVLINNAGIAKMNAFVLTPLSSLKKILDVNVSGTFLCSQLAVGLLRKAENPRIINMSTVAVPLQLEGEAAYACSKGAVETLTQIMAKELAQFGITCNGIGPSPIETDLIKNVGKEKIEALIQRQAVKSMATAQDVVHLAEFFLHPDSKMITGQIVYLGGIS